MQAEPADDPNLLCSSTIDSVSAEKNESSFELLTEISPVSKEQQPTLIKDTVYYMDTVVFKVQDHLFRVPTYYFTQKTSFFVPHFASLEAETINDEEEEEEEKFIELKDVTPSEFRALLKFIYPIQTNRLQDVPPAPTTDEWIVILKLSTQWMMLDIRRVAITVLSSADIRPADRVALAREHKVDSWLRSAYLELVNTASSMSQEDMNKVGLATSFKIHKARERYIEASNALSQSRYSIGYAIEPQGRSFRFQEMTTERSAVERVSLARAQGVAEYLRDAFIELVKRQEPLTVDESRTLGFDTAIRLYSARERRLVCTTMSPAPSTKVSTLINQELREELEALTTYQPVQRAVLAQRCGVAEWLHQAFVELMERSKGISVSEAQALGHETAISLCIAREAYTIHIHDSLFGRKSGSYNSDGKVGGFVDEELADELSALPSYGPVDRVLIAREAGVEQWFQTALNELVRWKEMVTDDEAVTLGLDTCIQLSRYRLENLGSSRSTWVDPGEINVEFKVELNDIQQASEQYIQPGIVLEEVVSWPATPVTSNYKGGSKKKKKK